MYHMSQIGQSCLALKYLILVAIATVVRPENMAFPKDQRTNVVFPPRNIRNKGTNVPLGHLRPFGRLMCCL